jgi:hypothetical protein
MFPSAATWARMPAPIDAESEKNRTGRTITDRRSRSSASWTPTYDWPRSGKASRIAMRRVVVESFLKDTSVAESRPYVTLTESRPGGVGARRVQDDPRA